MNDTRHDTNDSSFLEDLTHPQKLYSFGAAAALPFLKKAGKFAAKNPLLTFLLLGGALLGYFLFKEEASHPQKRVLH